MEGGHESKQVVTEFLEKLLQFYKCYETLFLLQNTN